MAYLPITDLETAPGKPGSSSLIRRLRDNPEAVYIGASGAPLILRKAISAGGTGSDGAWVDGTTVAGMGYFEPLSILWTISRALPSVSIIRCSGNVSITGSPTLTIPALDLTAQAAALGHLRASQGSNGGNGTYVAGSPGHNGSGGGGGLIGAGGPVAGSGGPYAGIGDGGLAAALASLRYPWLALNPKIGGRGGYGQDSLGFVVGTPGDVGGALVLLIEGDCDLTGAIIAANGAASADEGGAGAAGSIVIVCTGTLTGGEFHANGGAASGSNRCAAGGGYVGLVASAYAGSQVFQTNKGVAASSAALNGSDGDHEKITLTAAQIRGDLFRSY